MEKKLVVIDGNSLMHRAFYALPPLTNEKGEFTNAVFGFFSMLIKALDEIRPEYLAVAFDMKGKTFRHDKFTEYKAGRKETPSELIPQFPLLKDALIKLEIPVLEKEGMEADDFLGTLSKAAAQKDVHAILVTGDRDAFQLIGDKTTVYLTRKGITDTENYDAAKLVETYNLAPAQIVDLKGLMGDASDNIPGVPGVGEKTALKLLWEYGTIDGIYENIDKITGKLKERLAENRDLAYLSREIATIDTDIPLTLTVEDLKYIPLTAGRARPVFETLGFKSLLKRLASDPTDAQKEPEAAAVTEIAITEAKDLRALIDAWENKEKIAFVFGEKLYFAEDAKTEYSVEYGQSLLNMDFSYEAVLDMIRPLLESKQCKLFHGLKDVLHAARDYGIEVNGLCYDTMIAAYVLNPTDRDYSLATIAAKYGAAGHAAALFALEAAQKAAIEKDGLARIFNEIEMPLVRVLFDIEAEGFTVDLNELNALSKKLCASIDELTEEIYALGGGAFNINSTKQLGEVLFEKLGLPAVKKTKTGYSTDVEVLEALADAHPIIQKISDYRQAAKLNSTYIEGIRALTNKKTGRIHTTFKQETTATGRISSIEPNLQNIPVRTELGREIRRMFVPSEPGRLIIAGDYSQIELRILAHIADDPVMIQAFLEDEDIHRRTAAEVFDVALEDVTQSMRSSAKAVNFGIVYGISDFGLAKNLNISRKQAAAYIQKYLQEFAGVKAYMECIKAEAKEQGYVRTLWGRIRRIDELKSSNYNIRSFGERAALNTPIQGTAADIIKCAMIRVHRALRENGLLSRLILQVHDELIIDACAEEKEAVERILKQEMEAAAELKAPLKVNIASGKSWYEAK